MTKADIIDKFAASSGMTKTASEKYLHCFLDAIQESLIEGGKLTLAGFGVFTVESRGERIGRNPRTGDPITIPATKVVKFRPGKYLKESIK